MSGLAGFTGEHGVPYGLSADGRVRHIAQVPSGLACGCVCPHCKAVLVARKGQVRQHHFAHHTGEGCGPVALESALHLLAKEVFSQNRSMRLPSATAGYGRHLTTVIPEQDFTYEGVILEKDLDGLRPDIMVEREGRQLLVEVAVTHFCGEEKVQLIRKRDLPCIEIDLSGVVPFATREEHEEYILRSAPRIWIHNPKAAVANRQLLADIAQRKALAEKSFIRSVVKSWKMSASGVSGQYDGIAQRLGLQHLVGHAVAGERCFTVKTEVWQGVVLGMMATREGIHRGWSGESVLRSLRRPPLDTLLHAPFAQERGIDDELILALRAEIPDFVEPQDALEDYLEWLAEQGAVKKSWQGWEPDYSLFSKAMDRLELAKTLENNLQELESKARGLFGMLAPDPQAAALNASFWLDIKLEAYRKSPRELAATDTYRLGLLHKNLDKLRRLLSDDRFHDVDDLMGFPAEAIRDRKRAAAEAEKQRLLEERITAERALQPARMKKLDELAIKAFGTEGVVWVAIKAREVLDSGGGLSPDVLGPLGQEAVSNAIHAEAHRREVEADRRHAELMREAAKRQAAEEALEKQRFFARELHKRASFVLGEQKAQMFMNTTHPAIKGRPAEKCIDQVMLDKCLKLLPDRRQW